MRFSIVSVAVFTAATAFASPVVVSKRQSSTTCGKDYYSSGQVSAAADKGYQLYESGETLGSDSYPHEFHNYSGFDFPVSSPYYEFPILESGVYNGGDPGADRVIFNGDGQYAGAITHTGAMSYDGFVGCSGTS